MNRPECPRCRLELAGGRQHASEADCLSDIVPRYQMVQRARKRLAQQLDAKQRQTDNWRLRARQLENELNRMRSAEKRDIAGRLARLEAIVKVVAA